MKKILLIALIFLLTGCTQTFNGDVGIINKDIIVAGEVVSIGRNPDMLGGKDDKFEPRLRLNKWNGEVYIDIWSDDEVEDKATEKDNKIISKSKDGKREYNFYSGKNENGVEFTEYEVILLEKPDSNVIKLKIETKGLRFSYQDKLSKQPWKNSDYCTDMYCYDKNGNEIAHRPENIIGSYAVYHINKKHNKYKTGKAFHIYRPQMIDTNGWTVWGILDIKGNILSVTIPQNFIDNAVYPVRHATGLTLGYDTAGGSVATLSVSKIYGSYAFTPSVDGDVTQTIGGHFYRDNNGNNGDVRFVLYVDDTSDIIIDYGSVCSVLSSDLSPNCDFNQSGSVLSAKSYIVGVWVGGLERMKYDDNDGSINYCREAHTYHATNAPLSPIGWDENKPRGTIDLSMWIDYTEEGGADTCTPPATGDWTINSDDNCYVNAETFIDGDIYLVNTGAGAFNITADLNCQDFYPATSTTVNYKHGAKINTKI